MRREHKRSQVVCEKIALSIFTKLATNLRLSCNKLATYVNAVLSFSDESAV